MATPNEKLAQSLDVLQALVVAGRSAIRSDDLTRTHRERLVRSGFLREVMKGWYVTARPDRGQGESVAWYTAYWGFCADYLSARYGQDWCLSPEQSLLLHAENRTVPPQLAVRAVKGDNKPVHLPEGHSIFAARSTLPPVSEIVTVDGLRLVGTAYALTMITEEVYRRHATACRAALLSLESASGLLHILLENEAPVVAGRLIGALRNVGRARLADEVKATLTAAGHDVRVSDPFVDAPEHLPGIVMADAPVARLRETWRSMRGEVIDLFPAPPREPIAHDSYLTEIEERYVTDAYHSLSIEGYRVTPELIERVRAGKWDPDGDPTDQQSRDALAARGYHLAFQEVKASVDRVLTGADPGEVADHDHPGWYRALFGPGVDAGLVRPTDLAGYRREPVYIAGSRYVPPRHQAVGELMRALFDLLREEENGPVRVVLGHFAFVNIHPYSDGNGRMGRLLMNVMMAGAGYPWTVVPVERRGDYLAALEAASVDGEIGPLAGFIGGLVKGG